MALTGRAALLAALGSLPVGLLGPSWTGMLAVNGALALACAVDYALAAPVRRLNLTRTGDASVRLGEPAQVHLTVTNPGSRTLRARIRDAWPPSSWLPGTESEASRHTLTVPAGERRRITTRLLPTRRGDRRADRVTIRSYGPLGLLARQGTHSVPWTVRVLPPFTSRKHLPSRLARLRELDGRTSVLTRGEGTEFDSLRDYVPGDDTRSIDWRATARRHKVAVRTWRPERDRHILICLDTGRTSAGRVGDAPAWTPQWTRPCSWPRWPPARATASTCWPTTAAPAPRSRAARPATSSRPSSTPWPPWNRSSSKPTPAPWSPPSCETPRAGPWWSF